MVVSCVAHDTPTLNPLRIGSAPTGAGADLVGTWYRVDNNAHFSNYSYTETDSGSHRYGQTDAIKNFSWGSGIWTATDIATIAAIAAGNNSYVTAMASSLGSVSYSNNIYNNMVHGQQWRLRQPLGA